MNASFKIASYCFMFAIHSLSSLIFFILSNFCFLTTGKTGGGAGGGSCVLDAPAVNRHPVLWVRSAGW